MRQPRSRRGPRSAKSSRRWDRCAGPTALPASIAVLMPNTGPPRSRTAVKPRSSICRASSAARGLDRRHVALGSSSSRLRAGRHDDVHVVVDQPRHQRAAAAGDARQRRRRPAGDRRGRDRLDLVADHQHVRRCRQPVGSCRRRCARSRTAPLAPVSLRGPARGRSRPPSRGRRQRCAYRGLSWSLDVSGVGELNRCLRRPLLASASRPSDGSLSVNSVTAFRRPPMAAKGREASVE